MTRSACALFALLAAAGPLGAQMDPHGLPTGDRRLGIGDTVAGALTEMDATLPDGARGQAWRLDTPGLAVTVDLRSDDFDAFLYLVGPDGTEITDDDGGGACHARITHRIPPAGQYRVVVSSVGPDETGGFTLAVSEEPGPVDSAPCSPGMPGEVLTFLRVQPAVGQVRPGDELDGVLSSDDPQVGGAGPYVHIRDLVAPANQEITVELVSDAFDAFVVVVGPGLSSPLMDDDCAGGTNASLVFTTAADSGYRVIASSFSPGETGAYRLVVRQGTDRQTAACRAREDADDPDMPEQPEDDLDPSTGDG